MFLSICKSQSEPSLGTAILFWHYFMELQLWIVVVVFVDDEGDELYDQISV